MLFLVANRCNKPSIYVESLIQIRPYPNVCIKVYLNVMRPAESHSEEHLGERSLRERIAEELSWVEIISALEHPYDGTIRVRASGAIYLRCIFHEERTPSLVLWPSGNFKCYGCDTVGDKLDFVAGKNLSDRIGDDAEYGRTRQLLENLKTPSNLPGQQVLF